MDEGADPSAALLTLHHQLRRRFAHRLPVRPIHGFHLRWRHPVDARRDCAGQVQQVGGVVAVDIHRGDVVGFIVRSECDFFAPVAYPGEVDIGVAVVKLGNSSVTYETGLFKPGAPDACAVGRMVHVFVDTTTQRPVAIPASIRAALAQLVRPG